MKKVFLAVLFLTLGVTAIAQEKEKLSEKPRLSSEQKADLQVKQMKLDLDLTDKQVEEIRKYLVDENMKRETKRAEMQAKRAKGEKPSADEIYTRKSQMLDERLKQKEAMKKILTKEQFEKWEKKAEEKKAKVRENVIKKRSGRIEEPQN